MLDIPELDEMVCTRLDRNSLLQCAKVSKKWNEAVMPSIWRTIPADRWGHRWRTLRRLVLEDYYQEQYLLEQQRLQENPLPAKKKRGRPSKKPPPPREPWQTTKPLTLSKYGKCVRLVEGFDRLLKGLEPVDVYCRGKSKGLEYPIPSALDLARHFLKRCPSALFHFGMTHEYFRSDELFDLALTILPRATALSISGGYDVKVLFPFSKLKRVIATASDHLSSLSLEVYKFQPVQKSNEGASNSPEPEITARPQRLGLVCLQYRYRDTIHAEDWSWLWRACGQVQELEVHRLSTKASQSLSQGIRDSMPMLETIAIGENRQVIYNRGDGYEIRDHKIGPFLAACTKGWKTVRLDFTAQVGPETFAALLQHAETLEELSVVRVWDRTGIARLFKSCSKLRKLVTIDDEEHGRYEVPQVAVMDFIDWDPEARVMRPWPCKTTLETLAIKITGVPIRNKKVPLQEDRNYYGIHQRVLQRLGEFTNLKTLQLGHQARVRYVKGFNDRKCEYRYGEYEVQKQVQCLHFTFATGLRKLEGLQKLEDLCIPNMDNQIQEVPEVKWMVEHLPKLSRLAGIEWYSKANRWLAENHPEIRQ